MESRGGRGFVFKRKAKVRNKIKVSRERNSEAGEIDKVKGGSMTQEEELKLREVGRRIAQIVQKKE